MRSARASRKSRSIYIPKSYTSMGHKLRKYFTSVLIKDTSLLTCSYTGELRNDRKFKSENKPFIAFILVLKKSFALHFILFLNSIRTYSRSDEFDLTQNLNAVSDGR